MCDFNNLTDTEKQTYHDMLLTACDAFGGKSHFYELLEAIRATKPHPLTAKECEFRLPMGTVKWSKVIFADKYDLLLKERLQESKRGNFLPNQDEKNYKKVLNLVRTLAPITIEVKRKNINDGKGFSMKPFDIIDEQTTKLNPLFDALFFCAIDTVKKVLNYQSKA